MIERSKASYEKFLYPNEARDFFMSYANVPLPAPNSEILIISLLSKVSIRFEIRLDSKYPKRGCVKGEVA